MWSPIILSLKIATIATVFSFALGVFFAYIINKKKMPGKNIWETILILPMILPPSVMGYLLLIAFGKRGLIGGFLLEHFGIQIVFTWMGAVIAACIVSLPLMYQNVKAALVSMDPIYEKAAQTLGSSEWKIFRTVTFPLAWPGIISGIVLAFARAIGEFGATLMIAGNIPGKTQTIPTAIYFAVESGNTQLANRLVLIMTIFSFVLILGLNTWLKRINYIGKQG
ncbi:molybdate ABC transporter permease subunit [Sinanaerobacter chloroacetimidivorans]|jgi:molybdate transport system permease protein|uniref:Molybdenum transport system permease n=1 Tax=Sinanaerobacter chloroacetimidivorans TaxID=2818044 RepID=A0A8J7W067_9FIRM|nr:molybdate ABC transporter permease subunit [Sinanaerobacter chloroacetimidivorans]MBR0597936.1 molybdate ABC transporter permease subunit [Sinanaerobacter chloroacetimidivorans]